ncbi:MAG: SDR family NAD(P)-dependent oxidoreductase [Gemmatimonadaceae bacterium]
MQLEGRSAILTGASRGIGPHIARALARERVNLALVARSGVELEGSRGRSRPSEYAQFQSRPISPRSHRDITVVERAEREIGPIDILINNAGAHHAGALHTRTAAQVDAVVQVNLVATIDLTRRLLSPMLARRRGHVVHVASLAGKVPLPFFSIYTATTYALVGFNHALQIELRGTGVHSSAVCPGTVSGEGMWARTRRGVHPALGAPTPQRVARAVVDAVKHERVEQIVNPLPTRPVVALWALSPRVGAAVYRMLRIDKFFRVAAEGAESAS